MSPIVTRIAVQRPAEDVCAYATDPTPPRMAEGCPRWPHGECRASWGGNPVSTRSSRPGTITRRGQISTTS